MPTISRHFYFGTVFGNLKAKITFVEPLKPKTMFDNNEFKKYATKHRGINSLTYDSYASHITSSMTPYIIEERQLNVAQMDVFSRLMMDRIIFLGDAIYENIANIIQAQLL